MFILFSIQKLRYFDFFLCSIVEKRWTLQKARFYYTRRSIKIHEAHREETLASRSQKIGY